MFFNKGNMKRLLAVIMAGWLSAGPLGAVPPAPGVAAPDRNPCSINVEAALERASALRAAKRRGFGAPAAPPADLTPHVLVIRVDFTDRVMATSLATTQTFFSDLRAYYIENSYGVFQPTFTVTIGGSGGFGSFRMPSLKDVVYGPDCGGDVSCGDDDMLTDAVAAANPTYDFSQFDQIMLYHAGIGQETCTPSNSPNCVNHIWSVFFPVTGGFTVDAKTFLGFTVVPEAEQSPFSPLGVIAHEYGHQIGLPDLYDVSVGGGVSTLGAWDIMDYPYTNNGANPPHLGAWSKKFLGFSTQQAVSGTVTLSPAETTSTAFNQISIPSGGASEYFLMENRLKTAAGATYDKGLAESGLVLWHVDDAVALDTAILSANTVNTPSLSGKGHRGVEVVEADGVEPDPQPPTSDVGFGDAFMDGQTFTAPQSNAFNGQPSGVTIASISGAGTASLSSVVAFIKATTGTNALKAVNYPNPAGDPSKYPVRPGAPAGTLTTLVLQLTRPVTTGELELDIYNLNGDRVRSVSGPDIQLKLGAGEPSADFKWVYEYDWNGRNDAGGDVVSGVYIYRFKAGSEIKNGKLMIIR